MKKLLICISILVLSYSGYSQEFIDDSNFKDKINQKHAFTDDDFNIVIVEFWVKFNSKNAFCKESRSLSDSSLFFNEKVETSSLI